MTGAGRPRALLACALATLGCREAASALAPAPSQAAVHADGLLGAVAARFGPAELDARLAAARPRLARAALVPSRVFEDASVWRESVGGPSRRAEFLGERRAGRYWLGFASGAEPPPAPGVYRGTLDLVRLQGPEYEWTVHEQLAIGRVGVRQLAAALTALFRSGEDAGSQDLRESLSRQLPRSAAAFGRFLSLDELSLRPVPGGGTDVRVVVELRPERLAGSAPRYARFLQRYALPVRLQLELADDTGRSWWMLTAREGRATLRLRVRGGDLAPLADGASGRLPDRLHARLELSTRSGWFRVGFSGLEADVELTRVHREKGFRARFRREPEWQLPFLVEPLLRSSLRRPFEGDGAWLSYAAREDVGASTLLVREYRLAVRESWILRWLGGFVGGAVDEFRAGAEAEADRLSGDALLALRDDVVSLLAES